MTFTFEKKGHRYTLDGKPLTGVTTVLGVIAKPMLIGWAAKQTAEWIRENCGTFNDDLLGDEYFRVYEEDLQEAVQAHTKKKEAGGERGTDVHSLVEYWINECIKLHDGNPHADPQNEDKALRSFVGWARSNNVKFLASEKQVYSREWFVGGTFDFSFEKEGKRYIGDLKTMKKMWDRVPFFQTAAYRKMSIEMGEPHYDGSCIVNINKETTELTDHWSYDFEGDQKAFEAALTLYRQLSQF